jgi:aspartyl-tRNA(Asn)/glutamyl-tRNA(Gln) amidotransferase subunit A
MNDLIMMSASELVAGFRHRQLSPVDVISAVLDQVSRLDPVVNGLCGLDGDLAISAARASERRWMLGDTYGLLDGVPVTVKDLVAVQGLPTRYGSLTSSPDPAGEDAPAVARLRQAGAIVFGKTTTSEFGNKIVTDSPLTGITRNPWDTQLSPGGSSGGSAVAVALGMGPLSLATDGGGSIRIPACWSGVVGFKPSFGRVPAGAAGSWVALSTLGPIARNVGDAALMFGVMAGAKTGDVTQTGTSVEYAMELGHGVAGLRIAYCPAPAGVHVEPAISDCVHRAAALIEALGARVVETDLEPLTHYVASRMHSIQWSVLFAQRVRRMRKAEQAQLDHDVLELARAGERVDTPTLADALHARHALTVGMEAFFQRFDLLLMPTFHCAPVPVPGLPAGLRTAPALTSWCNQTGLPAVSVPCGLPGGLPAGLQIIGRQGADAMVLRVARAYEAARGPFPVPGIACGHAADNAELQS